METKDEKRITVRVSPDLYNQIVAAAREKNLTINAFIIQSLESIVVGDLKATLDRINIRLDEMEIKIRERNMNPLN